jgi:hypothetical protein
MDILWKTYYNTQLKNYIEYFKSKEPKKERIIPMIAKIKDSIAKYPEYYHKNDIEAFMNLTLQFN